jgi:ABC-type glycerol-3-phosphate transport system substrate-binding protein
MKSHTKPKLRFRWLILLGTAFAGLGLVNAPAEVTTVEIVHYFSVQGQIDALNQLQKDFEAANPDIKIHYTYVPFAELVSRTLQMAAVHKPPGISAIDNPDVLRVAKAGILEDISADVTTLQVWNDMYPGPKAAVTEGSKVSGMPIGSNSRALY